MDASKDVHLSLIISVLTEGNNADTLKFYYEDQRLRPEDTVASVRGLTILTPAPE